MMSSQVKIGDVATIVMGQAPPKADTNREERGVPFVKVGEFSDKYPVVREWTTNPLRMAEVGDVLVCVVGSIGKVNLGIDSAIGRSVAAIRPSEKIDQHYLHYLIHYYTEDLRKAAQGTTQGVLTKENLISLNVPHVDIQTQKRIVEVLDDQLSRLDKALAEVSQNRLRFSILKKSYLDAVYRGALNPNIAKPTTVRLSEVAQIINGDRGKNYPSKSHRVSEGIPFINAGHVDQGVIDMSTMDFISPERFDLLGSGKVSMGDVLFCLRGSLGKVGLVTDIDKGAIASSLAIVRPKDQILSEYLLGYFQTSTAGEMIRRFDNGTAQPNLSAANLAKFEVPLFPFHAQAQIVAEVQGVKENLEALESTQAHLTSLISDLRRSVLNSAFQDTLESSSSCG